jgi:hypothetical protein
MPRGIPKNRTNGPTMTKTEAVKRALAELGQDAKPLELQKHIKTQFGIHMEPQHISNYKSTLKGAGKSALIRKPVRKLAPAAPAGGISLDDIRAVKQVIDKIGADKVRQLAEVLAK